MQYNFLQKHGLATTSSSGKQVTNEQKNGNEVEMRVIHSYILSTDSALEHSNFFCSWSQKQENNGETDKSMFRVLHFVESPGCHLC